MCRSPRQARPSHATTRRPRSTFGFIADLRLPLSSSLVRTTPQPHFYHPRHGSQVVNPLYGIRCTVYLDVDDGLVRDIGFEGTGCAILLASGSLMTLAVSGK